MSATPRAVNDASSLAIDGTSLSLSSPKLSGDPAFGACLGPAPPIIPLEGPPWQSNYGGVLTIAGAPVGRELGRYYLKDELERASGTNRVSKKEDSKNQISNERAADGSIIIIIATDAPIDYRNLRRMAARAMMGLARTGSAATNGSGDYAIAFSTAPEVRIRATATERNAPRDTKLLANDAMSPLFLAVIEATEEAIYNSMFRATTMTGRGRTIEALPLDRVIEILRKYGALARQK